jgi:lysophospholipase L1-like esterase
MKEVIEFFGNEPHATMQSFYIKDRRIGLTPNLVVVLAGRKWFETNSWGMRSPEPEPGKKLVAIWGDSVVFGIGSPTWVDLLGEHFQQHQFLNGGIEGSEVDHIVERAIRINQEHKIDVNVLFPGWHPSGPVGSVNTTIEKVLREGVEKIPNCILSTVPTALNEQILDTDLTPYRATADATSESLGKFRGWGRDLSPSTMKSVYERLLERNAIIRRVAQEREIPLFDWFAAMRTTSLEDFHKDFYDILHPRQKSYAKIAQIWAEGLRPYLR